MAIVQFVIVFCFVVMIVVFALALCAAVGGLVWCLKDVITDWKQYRLKDRVMTIQEYNELMDSL